MATRIKPTEQKALAWYMDKESLKPMLSTYPKMFFKNADGEEVIQDIRHITRAYKERDKGKR